MNAMQVRSTGGSGVLELRADRQYYLDETKEKLNVGYIGLSNTFLLPHIGSATVESRTNMGMTALDNIDAVLNGRPAPSLAMA